MQTKVIVAVVLVIVGLVLIFGVPTAREGPVLIPITEQHAIRLVDAIGLVVAIIPWLYLNFLVVRLWTRRRRPKSLRVNDTR